jgi:hypothetical protein
MSVPICESSFKKGLFELVALDNTFVDQIKGVSRSRLVPAVRGIGDRNATFFRSSFLKEICRDSQVLLFLR